MPLDGPIVAAESTIMVGDEAMPHSPPDYTEDDLAAIARGGRMLSHIIDGKKNGMLGTPAKCWSAGHSKGNRWAVLGQNGAE